MKKNRYEELFNLPDKYISSKKQKIDEPLLTSEKSSTIGPDAMQAFEDWVAQRQAEQQARLAEAEARKAQVKEELRIKIFQRPGDAGFTNVGQAGSEPFSLPQSAALPFSNSKGNYLEQQIIEPLRIVPSQKQILNKLDSEIRDDLYDYSEPRHQSPMSPRPTELRFPTDSLLGGLTHLVNDKPETSTSRGQIGQVGRDGNIQWRPAQDFDLDQPWYGGKTLRDLTQIDRGITSPDNLLHKNIIIKRF